MYYLSLGITIDSENILFAIIIIWIITRSYILYRRKKRGKPLLLGKEVINNLFYIYLLLLIYITLIPINIYFGDKSQFINNTSLTRRLGINLIPFYDYYSSVKAFGIETINIYFIRSIIGNILLLIPFTLYLCSYVSKIRTIKNTLVVSFIISLSIELLQLVENYLNKSPYRTVNVDDLILNTLGGILGYFTFKVLYKTKLKAILNIT